MSAGASHKPERYHTLDAMRGVAAIGVVAFHVGKHPSEAVASGYVAVDFFFALSGFVVARAYAAALADGLGFWMFLRKRLIRLYPMYAVGFLVGLAILPSTVGSVAFNTLMLPAFGETELYPSNSAHWSLFYELVANAVFALILWRAPTTLLALAAVAFTAWLATEAILTGTMNAGWHWQDAGFSVARVGFPFIIGVLLSRDGMRSRQSHLALLPILALALGLLPFVADRLTYGLFFALIATPCLLVLGIVLELPPAWRPTATRLADLSYPIYCIHLPLTEFSGRADTFFGWSPWTRAGAFVAVNVVLAYAALRLIDEPVRRWLSRLGRRALPAA